MRYFPVGILVLQVSSSHDGRNGHDGTQRIQVPPGDIVKGDQGDGGGPPGPPGDPGKFLEEKFTCVSDNVTTKVVAERMFSNKLQRMGICAQI